MSQLEVAAPRAVEELIEALSLKAFVKISNTFDIWFATPEARKWKVEINHVTYREFEKTFEGSSLGKLLKLAWFEIEHFERTRAHESNRTDRTGI